MADGRRGLSRIWSRKAAAIAALAVFFDGVLHYALPSSVAIQEGAAYFIVKFAAVELAAALLLSTKVAKRPWTPILIGVVGSSAFGTLYYAFPRISAEPGYLTLPYRLLWGVIHALAIWAAAALVLRKPLQFLLAFALLSVTVAVAVLVPLGSLW